jgi:hypothetical protein
MVSFRCPTRKRTDIDPFFGKYSLHKDDRILLPLLEPMIAGNERVAFVGFAVAISPLLILGAGESHPAHQAQRADLGAGREPLDKIDPAAAGRVTANKPYVPKRTLREMANRSVDWWVMSEDLPNPERRVILGAGGRIEVIFRPNNLAAHDRLIRVATRMLKAAGYPIVFVQRMGIETNSHQCGTIKFGTDPAIPFVAVTMSPIFSSLTPPFFPSSAAVNPALTIAAQALRVADHILGRSAEIARTKAATV